MRLLNRARNCWVRCAPPPVDEFAVYSATSCGGDAVFAYAYTMDDDEYELFCGLLAFDCTQNSWRRVDAPLNLARDIADISSMHDRLIVSSDDGVRHQTVEDGGVWRTLPEVPHTREFGSSFEHIGGGVVNDKNYVWHANYDDEARMVTRMNVYDNFEWTNVVTMADDRKLAPARQLEFTVVGDRIHSFAFRTTGAEECVYDTTNARFTVGEFELPPDGFHPSTVDHKIGRAHV